MKNKRAIFLFAGGSGGHIIPALVLKDKLEAQRYSVTLFLDRSLPAKDARNLKRMNISRNKLKFLLQFPLIFLYILIYALIKKAETFVGFGGYYSLPGILVSKFVKARAIIYEPNVTMGKANKFLSHISNYIFILWRENFPMSLRRKLVKIKPLIREIKHKPSDSKGIFSILVTGGSRGSLFMNVLILNLIQNYKFKNRDFRITLISGKRFYTRFRKMIEADAKLKNLNIQILDYCYDIEVLYESSHLLISRAGAQSLVESVWYLLPGVFIPYPYASGHQIENARYLHSRGACFYFEENVLDWKVLGDVIHYFQANPRVLEDICQELKKIKEEMSKASDPAFFLKIIR